MILPPHAQQAVDALIRQVAVEIVLPRYQNLAAHEISEKAVDDLVTIADKESELRLAEGLMAILPGSHIVGEEGCAADPALIDRIGDGLVWIVDPIDGTGNFAAGRPPFGIMVALATDGEVTAGWIYDPLADRMCRAMAGGGAFVNGARVSALETGAPLPIAGISLMFVDASQRARLIERAAGTLNMVDIPRCAAEQYARLVLGENDLALFERMHPWDHAPGILFLEEAGGRAAHADGGRYRVTERRRGCLAAASPRLWDKAARVLFD